MRITYSQCPCCKGVGISKVLSAKDHTVSSEIFDIWECDVCSARFTQNVPDETEIIRYYQSENYISHSNTNKGFINAAYHVVKKQTLKSKKQLIQKYTKQGSGNILDIGAGTGAFLQIMYEANWNVLGLEPNSSAREKAKELYGLPLQPVHELYYLKPETFDAITLWHVLEHVHDLHGYLAQFKKVLKKKGFLFIAVPNYTSNDATVYKESWAAYDVPRHLYHFSPQSITQLLLQHGLQLKEIKPMWYDSFYISMLSEKYKTGRSNFLTACINGWLSNWKALLNKERCSSLIYILTQ